MPCSCASATTTSARSSCSRRTSRPGASRVFLEAKGHPFHGEEYLDKSHDLYRDLFASNIRRIVDHANQIFFETRQCLDALLVIQANPKPEHRAYRDVLSGFYGEYLEDTPGVRDTVTVFGNCSDESKVEAGEGHGSYGVPSVVIGPRDKVSSVAPSEFSIDDELDPRSSRIPLKVHGIFCPTDGGRWRKLSGDEILQGL